METSSRSWHAGKSLNWMRLKMPKGAVAGNHMKRVGEWLAHATWVGEYAPPRWAGLIVGGFVVLAFCGYTIPGMDWTGFTGNTLWDWLQLLLVPLVLGAATVGVFADSRPAGCVCPASVSRWS